MQIAFIQTGGTIDKDYPKVTKGWAFEIGEPAFNRILEKLNPSFTYQPYEVFKKDSQEITSEDRAKLKALCESIPEDKIIITHGTDTMAETARSLSGINKTIIITGAMKPERFSNSDAPINLGAAIHILDLIGMDLVLKEDMELTNYCLQNMLLRDNVSIRTGG